MDIITDSVNKLEKIVEHSGCEDTGVCLEVDPDCKYCQYDRGACMIASFGGRSAEFVTDDPIRAMTKISFMYGAALDTPATRSAACAIVNVATGFFCLSRVLHSCPAASHAPCRQQLQETLAGKRVFFIGAMPALENDLRGMVAGSPEDADVILINSEGIIRPETGDLIGRAKETTRIICLGPSTAGTARLRDLGHWCPYGT